MKFLTRTVIVLSLVSLFTDMASEMLYPIMPVYLKSIGFSVLLIGILEGMAEGISGFSKGYFGKLSDSVGKRAPFVQLGYGLSALSKPMLAVFTFPLWVFFSRALDRLGKGIRTAPRDAILSAETTPGNKGKVFGFHRGMDTLGAVIGPSLALLYLFHYPENYKPLFLIAFLPGIAAVVCTLIIRDKKAASEVKSKKHPSFFSFIKYWKESSPTYRKVVGGILVFSLFNSSDMFLLLQAKQSGINDVHVIGLYIFYNLVYAICSLPAGIISDKLGLKNIFTVSLFIFAFVYFGFGIGSGIFFYTMLFSLYGIYAAMSEGISKAWITNLVPPGESATAVGTLAAFQSICAMLASAIGGLIWYSFGAGYMFVLTGIVTVLVAIYFILGNFKPLIKQSL